MYDEQGIWHDDEYHQPTSGGIAGLDIMNATNSYQNYRRAREAGVLSTMLKLRENPDVAQSVAATPEGAEALQRLDISPESVQSMYDTSPEQRFRTGVTPEMGESDISRLGLTTGAVKPKDYMTAWNRNISASAKAKTADTGADKALGQALDDAYKNEIKVNDSPRAAATSAVAKVRVAFPNADEKKLQDYIEAHGEETGGETGAKITHLGAQTDEANAKAQATLETIPGRISVLDARAGDLRADAAFKELKKGHLNGTATMTPGQMLTAAEKAQKLALDYTLAATKIDQSDPRKRTMTALAAKYQKESEDWKVMAKGGVAAPPAPSDTPAAPPAAAAPAKAPGSRTTIATPGALTPAEQDIIDKVKAGQMTPDQARQARALLGG